jgi:hypothetical protein
LVAEICASSCVCPASIAARIASARVAAAVRSSSSVALLFLALERSAHVVALPQGARELGAPLLELALLLLEAGHRLVVPLGVLGATVELAREGALGLDELRLEHRQLAANHGRSLRRAVSFSSSAPAGGRPETGSTLGS